MEKIIEFAINNGRLELALFVSLLLYVLKTNGDREKRYQNVIEVISQTNAEEITKIKDKLESMSTLIEKINENMIKLIS